MASDNCEEKQKSFNCENTADEKGVPDEDIEQPAKISKRQLKKQLKTQRWLEHKYQKRQDERVKKKERRKAAKERGDELGPSRKRLKQNRMEDSRCKVKVVVDCSFDDLMKDREICSLVSQISFCYAANRRSKNPLQFYVTSKDGKTETRLQQMGDHQHWDIHFRKEHFDEVFSKQEVVYLSSDSDNVLEDLSDDMVYVIGGLVDHNAHKGHCHALAQERGYQHAQLPIGKYMELKSRKVLAINHVFEILLHFAETRDWEQAFYRVIPKRKVATDDDESSTRNVDEKNKTEHTPSDDDSNNTENHKEKHLQNITETKANDDNDSTGNHIAENNLQNITETKAASIGQTECEDNAAELKVITDHLCSKEPETYSTDLQELNENTGKVKLQTPEAKS